METMRRLTNLNIGECFDLRRSSLMPYTENILRNQILLRFNSGIEIENDGDEAI
jgi:hypothetical protein